MKLQEEQALVASLLASPQEKQHIERACQHDQWRPVATLTPPDASHAGPVQASLERASSFVPSIQVKEELHFPAPKRLCMGFGVIDVDADDCVAAGPGHGNGVRLIGHGAAQILDDDFDEGGPLGRGFDLNA